MTTPHEARVAGLSEKRRALLAQWLDSAGTPEPPAADDLPVTDTERVLAEVWEEVLQISPVRVTDGFLALGGDSITSLQVVAKATWRGLHLTSRQVIESMDLRSLAAAVTPISPRSVEDDIATGRVGLTPIQQWFFEQELPNSHYWDQAILLDVDPGLDSGVLAAALDDVIRHHDALRSTFRCVDGSWEQTVTLDASTVGVQVSTGVSLPAAIRSAQNRIDLASGRMVSAIITTSSDDQRPILLLAIHHLVVDGVSLRILVDDLETAYQARVRGRVPVLPPKSASMRSWSDALREYARTPRITRQLDYWRAVPDAAATQLPADYDTVSDTMATCRTISAVVGPEVTARLLHEIPRRHGRQVQHLLLASLLSAFRQRTGRQRLQLDLEGHGREPLHWPIDVSRTVGWFTTIYPVCLPIDRTPLAVLARVEQEMAAVPDRGIGYGLLRYLGGEESQRVLAGLSRSRLSFNYLGRFDRATLPGSVFGVPVEVPTVLQSDEATRPYAVEVVATVVTDRLTIEWRYNSSAFAESTVRSLLQAQVQAITELADLVEEAAPGPSAFPLATISADQIESVRRQIQGDGR
ncbi:condensation domain-containing protein [Actinoplanes derwentensis]|uniref:Non-ribosomal peptide synthase domain TIGR01720 n=1 Tax=Actinoplanes derwentensis TaxID=113562 RepID=A0A1H2DCP0_9ACTN|nr:condensation domain-containing protein [Actinoplanes derwentensis]GID89558.1 hypothetical protein Ade03nite_84820 [Actinoplanes derwentensis]SDT80515.1 non-ribosomal peptide synthase domain TIGR01720 [Actinoplanes derwentensis]